MPTLTMRRSFVLAIAVATGCGPAPIDAVMSWDEYVRIEHPTPYIVRRTREHGELLYFGARHVREPGDPQVAQIQELWSEFRPTVLLYEGPTHPAPTDLSEAIAARGEGGVVRWLATRDHVPARSLDPTEAEQVQGLRDAGYAWEEIVLWYCLRQLVHERRLVSAAALDDRMLAVFAFYRGVPGLETMPRSVAEFDRRVREKFPEIAHWREVSDAWSDPASTPDGWSNAFSRRLSAHRDRHMVHEIENALEEGARVFAIAGASHVVMQEPALTSSRMRARR